MQHNSWPGKWLIVEQRRIKKLAQRRSFIPAGVGCI